MRIYMQLPPGEDHTLRYFQLILQPDLLQGWWLVTEAGIQGGPSRIKRQYFDSQDTAFAVFTGSRDAQLMKGYRVMFVQGQDMPVA